MTTLVPPENFNFPFVPYDIQEDFMRNLFTTLEEKKFGIFESPTGTGKSLSLICGALAWLQLHLENEKEMLKEKVDELVEDDDLSNADWFSSAIKKREVEEIKKIARKKLDKILNHEKKMTNLRKKKQKVTSYEIQSNKDEFNELFKDLAEVRQNVRRELESFHSENEISHDEENLIIDDIEMDDQEKDLSDEEGDEEDRCLKIYYCSRTHSQLTQFVREIQKTLYSNHVRVTALASRHNLCINETVTKLSSLSLINERCLEMQKAKKSETSKTDDDFVAAKKRKISPSSCPFNKQSSIGNLSDQILTEVQDLEQLVSNGKKTESCPYYASRNSIKDSQLVVLPYNTLLHKDTRKACKIRLKDNIVIVDEAHNLLETLANIHSAVITYSQVCGAHSQLNHYLKRYNKRLSAQNCLYIQQIIFFLKGFIKLFTKEKVQEKSRLVTLQELLTEVYIDNLNIFELVQFIEKTKLANKLHGFSQFFEGQVLTKDKEKPTKVASTSSFLSKLSASKSKSKLDENISPLTEENCTAKENCSIIPTGSPLLSVTQFMKTIICGSSDGRVVIHCDQDKRKAFVKFVLLNPASQFHEVVQQCRSVIVAGGTMSPMTEFQDQLFVASGASKDRVVQFTCGHVVPDENILPIVFKCGPGNVKLEFTYDNRYNPSLLNELGRILQNLSNVVPGGMVVFFPSYEYEESVNRYLTNNKTIEKVSEKKRIFREPKRSGDLDKVFSDYRVAVKEGMSNYINHVGSKKITGAILFCVVGGKMSEGINFSDDLGRCVVMVGLPYPNTHSPELKEKIAYLNSHFAPNEEGIKAGSVFYENLCFKAVNQSIGRSIRHKGDYSSIILLDHRYSREKSIQALPLWISSRTKICDKFGQAFGLIRKFFIDKRTKEECG